MQNVLPRNGGEEINCPSLKLRTSAHGYSKIHIAKKRLVRIHEELLYIYKEKTIKKKTLKKSQDLKWSFMEEPAEYPGSTWEDTLLSREIKTKWIKIIAPTHQSGYSYKTGKIGRKGEETETGSPEASKQEGKQENRYSGRFSVGGHTEHLTILYNG